MGRRFLVVLCAALCAPLVGACEDPLVIIGDLPGFMRVTVGIPDSAGTRLDSIATRTRLSTPAGIVVDSAGTLFVGDQRSRIFRVASNGRIERLLNHDPCFEKTCVGRPQGLAVAPDGTILIADDMSDKVWRLNPVNRALTVVAGTGINAVAPDGAIAAQSPLASPTGVLVLPDGRILIAERNANRIRSIGSDGILRTLSSNLSLPTALAFANNTLYVSETGPMTVSTIDLATGIATRVAGNGQTGYSGDGGAAIQAAFNYPASIAVSGSNLFITDQNNHRIRVVNLRNGVVTTFAGTGNDDFTGNGRGAAETSLWFPAGIAKSPYGFLYISDGGHHVVWRTPIRVGDQ